MKRVNLTKLLLNTNQAIKRSRSEFKMPIKFEDLDVRLVNAPSLINFVDCAGLNNIGSKVFGLQIKVHTHLWSQMSFQGHEQRFTDLAIIFVGPKLTKQEWSSRNPTLAQPKFRGGPYLPKTTKLVDSQLFEEVKLLFPELKRAIREHLKDPLIDSFSNILFVGHSLGGAYASIAGYLWAKEVYEIESYDKERPILITFGAPRVGNPEFRISGNKAIYHYRITHGNDHVPHFPLATMGWKHFGHEIWIEPLDTCDCTEYQEKYWDCDRSQWPQLREIEYRENKVVILSSDFADTHPFNRLASCILIKKPTFSKCTNFDFHVARMEESSRKFSGKCEKDLPDFFSSQREKWKMIGISAKGKRFS
ncbi:hypothetical protein G9A89_001838 [Geosiphon pyriformis]|nr:hypothetical protein G9A89_001838 [Geosiphon pyriformis]